MPFKEKNRSDLEIVQDQRHRAYAYPRKMNITLDCQSTVDSMMTFFYQRRPNIKEVLTLPWFIRNQPST
ncbi:hypothetical protein AB6A40_006186 [Gnathostoma spinigerum]|uniref:Uncharacterized protein n=1 Tax=Gnathostoma spinigerum TaxID=75299 RepID=A0ABD6ESE6_9BILA